jgi:hypothetical protein
VRDSEIRVIIEKWPGRKGAPGALDRVLETMRTVIRHQNLFMTGIAVAVLGGWLILA